jgi:hypothetical protein
MAAARFIESISLLKNQPMIFEKSAQPKQASAKKCRKNRGHSLIDKSRSVKERISRKK